MGFCFSSCCNSGHNYRDFKRFSLLWNDGWCLCCHKRHLSSTWQKHGLLVFLPATWRWLSSVRSTPGRPSPASTSPSTRPRSPSRSATTRSTPRCPTCPWRAARCRTKTAGWPIAFPERLACPRTTWPGPSATSPTKRRRPTAAWRWVFSPSSSKAKS